jgi:hypothetical protein
MKPNDDGGFVGLRPPGPTCNTGKKILNGMYPMFRLFLAALFLSICAPGSARESAVVYDMNFKPDGRSMADLSADWWKWAMASPDEVNPVRDRSGAHCAEGQRGGVWFLAGGFGSSRISRTCEIPAGKYIFFPIINMVYWPSRSDFSYTCEQAKKNAAMNNDTALDLFVELDGVAVREPGQFRVSTEECFDVFDWAPAESKPYIAFPSASDGYWILLRPLAPGKHTLKFGGRYKNRGVAYGRMLQDIEYEITVR